MVYRALPERVERLGLPVEKEKESKEVANHKKAGCEKANQSVEEARRMCIV
jgi:hypothetical protein